jgi:hypothetical protein
MNAGQTVALPAVDPIQLEAAYTKCAHLFGDADLDGSVRAQKIVSLLGKTQPLLNADDTIDLFHRLCLTVQLVTNIEAVWDEHFSRARPQTLPIAFFELAGSETAFEETVDGYTTTFFARDVIKDALGMLCPN